LTMLRTAVRRQSWRSIPGTPARLHAVAQALLQPRGLGIAMGATGHRERTHAAMAHMRAQGRRISHQPRYGARFDVAGRVQADPQEQATLSAILRLREAGHSLRAISAELARNGILARSGRPFTASTLGQLVRKGPLTDTVAS
jgi:hypothetical protein